jgi:hypothetical protein
MADFDLHCRITLCAVLSIKDTPLVDIAMA